VQFSALTRTKLISAAVALTLAACGSPQKSVTTAPVLLDPELLPEINLSPLSWETCGDERSLSITLNEPALETMNFVFEYEGDGSVRLPESATINVGETAAALDGELSTKPTDEVAQGTVFVRLTDQQGNRYTVAEWPVLQRPSIIAGIDVARLPINKGNLSGHYYSCLVSVELDQLENGIDTSGIVRDFEVTASIKKQGAFDPAITIHEDVEPKDLTVTPKDFQWPSDTPVTMVEVAKPKFPATHRAFMEIRVSYGGDTITKTVPLPTR